MGQVIPASGDSDARLAERWCQGDEQAAAMLFERFFGRLLALVRGRISTALAPRFDPEDVVQSAYRSFFGGVRDGRYAVGHGTDLWQLLVVITLHKLQNRARWNMCDKRSVRREVAGALADVPAELLAREPAPAEVVALVDEVEHVMRGLDAFERKVLELRLQGCTLQEIVAQSQRSFASVRWALDQIKERLEDRYRERRSAPGLPEGAP